MRVVGLKFQTSAQLVVDVDENSVLRLAAATADCMLTTNPTLQFADVVPTLPDGTVNYPIIWLGVTPFKLEQLNLQLSPGEKLYCNASNPSTFLQLIFELPSAIFP